VTEEREGPDVCERCGRVKTSPCACGGAGHGGGEAAATKLEGFDPELTRSTRPRLGLVARPEPPE
jgi:hypothetical protein